MTGSDFRPGLENRFVWTGQSRRNWRLGLKVALTCAACIGGGYYIGRATVHQSMPTTAAMEKPLQDVAATKPEPAASTSVVRGGRENTAQWVPDKTAAGAMQPSQPAAAPEGDKAVANGSGGKKAEAASKAAAPTPARIINADVEKGRHEPSADGQEKPRTQAAAPKKKKVLSERQGEREKPAAEPSSVERNDAYVPPRAAGYGRDNAYVPPRVGYRRNDADVPPRTGYERDDDYPPPRMGYGTDRYGEPWRSRRSGLMYDDYDPRDVPRDAYGYLRDFRDSRRY